MYCVLFTFGDGKYNGVEIKDHLVFLNSNLHSIYKKHKNIGNILTNLVMAFKVF